jgi:hypothetical protein
MIHILVLNSHVPWYFALNNEKDHMSITLLSALYIVVYSKHNRRQNLRKDFSSNSIYAFFNHSKELKE